MKTEIKLPDGWNEVSLFQFQEIVSLGENEDKTNAIIAILANVDIEVPEMLSPESREQVLNHLEWTNTWPDEKRYNRKVTVEGKDYFLADYDELLIGERIDLKNYDRDRFANLHKIFSILYKTEDGKRGDPSLFNEKMNIGDVYGALVFFCLIASRSVKILQQHLVEQTMTKMTARQAKQKRKEKSA